MINKLKKKILKKIQSNSCEVEDLLELVPLYFQEGNNVMLFLENIKIDYLEEWIYYIKVLFSEGPEYLINLCKDQNLKHKSNNIIISILAAGKNELSVMWLLDILDQAFKKEDLTILSILLTEFNLLMSFKGAPKISDVNISKARELLHQILINDFFEKEADIALVLLSLRSVGNLETIDLINSKKIKLNDPYESVVNIVKHKIKQK